MTRLASLLSQYLILALFVQEQLLNVGTAGPFDVRLHHATNRISNLEYSIQNAQCSAHWAKNTVHQTVQHGGDPVSGHETNPSPCSPKMEQIVSSSVPWCEMSLCLSRFSSTHYSYYLTSLVPRPSTWATGGRRSVWARDYYLTYHLLYILLPADANSSSN